MGLAIVETAIQQHRGWVKAEDSPLGGLRLVIWLPLYKWSQTRICRQDKAFTPHPAFDRMPDATLIASIRPTLLVLFSPQPAGKSSILPLSRRFCIVRVQLFDNPAAESKR